MKNLKIRNAPVDFRLIVLISFVNNVMLTLGPRLVTKFRFAFELNRDGIVIDSYAINREIDLISICFSKLWRRCRFERD